jgi:copper chaperone NosL
MKLLNFVSALSLILFYFTITSCSKKAEEINYSNDECDYCRMQISDNRYAAKIVVKNDKLYKFDSIECLIGFTLVKNIVENDTMTYYVCDFSNPGNFQEVKKSFFVHNDKFMSPMALNVQSFSSQSDREKFVKENGGTEINWDDVVNMVIETAQ